MAEYIDRDELLKELCTVSAPTPSESWIVEKCIEKVNEQPTADVVPKCKVESMSHKCEDCAGCTQWVCDCSLIEEHAKTEVAREIFEEIEGSIAVHAFTSKSEDYADGMYDAIEWVDSKIAELKKKYLEGSKEAEK